MERLDRFVEIGGRHYRVLMDQDGDRIRQDPASRDIAFTVAGRTYVWRVRERCSTCRSHDRLLLEQAVMDGVPFSQAVRRADPAERPSVASLRNHFRRLHTPFNVLVRDQLADFRRLAWLTSDSKIP